MGVFRSSNRELSLDLRAYARVVKEGSLLKQSHYLKQWREYVSPYLGETSF